MRTAPLPRAPYLVRAWRHPSALGVQGIRRRLRLLSAAAGARRSDGTPLRLHPHDCRRVFATEHLNNNTPVHVIQALLGHATIDTVMVYAKLYPQTLVEEYRKAVRGLYIAFHGEEAGAIRQLRNGKRSQRAVACGIWAPTYAPSPRASTARRVWSAWDVPMRNRRKVRHQSFGGCWPATNANLQLQKCAANPSVR